MNASVEAVPSSHRAHLAPVPTPEMVVREGMLDVPGDVSLYHGGRLSGIRIAWRLAGRANAPVVCALGGISANRRVFVTEEDLPQRASDRAAGEGIPSGGEEIPGRDGLAHRTSGPRQGWWSEVVGPGAALDADRFRVLSFDYLGGSADTTGPASTGVADTASCTTAASGSVRPASQTPGSAFPNISTYDQAELLVRLLNNLGLKSLRAIVGGSYGGMVALAFGERYPERVSQLVVIGAADRTHPMATAWRSVQRQILRFSLQCGRPKDGLKLARALAMSTYRSAEEFEARFDGAPSRDGERYVFPVEQYIFARGNDFANKHSAEAILCLSESIDLHRVDAARIFVPTTIVAVREDQLVPLADLRGLAARLPAARLHEISSIYGHDAFLKESDQLRGIFAVALGGAA
jgi:homoserine O-acetyltransferase/O-succinyltransferase